MSDVNGNVLLQVASHHAFVDQVFIRSRLPLVSSELQLAETNNDSARFTLTKKGEGTAWVSWRLDDGLWSNAVAHGEITIKGLAVGPHHLELRTYNGELTPSPEIASLSFDVQSSSPPGFLLLISRLVSEDIRERNAATRSLNEEGEKALLALKLARQTAAPDLRRAIDEVIFAIERSRNKAKAER